MKRLVLGEGHKYDIQRAVVVPNDGDVRPTRHPFTLVFDMYSEIVLLERHPLITYGLSTTTSSLITRNRSDTHFLVDMVGLMTSISCERNYVQSGKDVKAVFLELTDPTGITECALYDNHVDEILHFLRHHGPVTPIIVVQFARIATNNVVVFGESAIEGCGLITRLLFNPVIPEAGLFVVWGKIMIVVEEDLWWQSQRQQPPNHSQQDISYNTGGHYPTFPRFNIKVQVFNGKDFAFFDLPEEDEPDYFPYPPIFSRLHGQSLLFLVQVGDDGFCTVIKVCADPEVVRMFIKGEKYPPYNNATFVVSRLFAQLELQADYFSHLSFNALASDPSIDNLSCLWGDMSQPSSSIRAPFNNRTSEINADFGNDEWINKFCVNWTSRNE
ncbi:hypothetical protein SESBI_49196 [Sesbania bispinosa]|nr:hypothetical protein SESBI_49196 [Sesbania bispinosa]